MNLDDLKKTWPIAAAIAFAAILAWLNTIVSNAKELYKTGHNLIWPQPQKEEDKFTLHCVRMGFVVQALSEKKIEIVGETISPEFTNGNSFPLTVMFLRHEFTINGIKAPDVPPDDITTTFDEGVTQGWAGSDPRVSATNKSVLNGYIDIKVSYKNKEHQIDKTMTVRGRVVGRLPRAGRIVVNEWWPDPDSSRAQAQSGCKYVVLAPDAPLSKEDQAVMDYSIGPRL